MYNILALLLCSVLALDKYATCNSQRTMDVKMCERNYPPGDYREQCITRTSQIRDQCICLLNSSNHSQCPPPAPIKVVSPVNKYKICEDQYTKAKNTCTAKHGPSGTARGQCVDTASRKNDQCKSCVDKNGAKNTCIFA